MSHDSTAKQSKARINHHSPNAFSPVPCDQLASSHNPRLSWFLITLAVRTDKGQGHHATRPPALMILYQHTLPPNACFYRKAWLLYFAQQHIYQHSSASEDWCATNLFYFFNSIFLPQKNKGNKDPCNNPQASHLWKLKMGRGVQQTFQSNQVGTITNLAHRKSTNMHMSTCTHTDSHNRAGQ